jgi:hypothetical protein
LAPQTLLSGQGQRFHHLTVENGLLPASFVMKSLSSGDRGRFVQPMFGMFEPGACIHISGARPGWF